MDIEFIYKVLLFFSNTFFLNIFVNKEKRKIEVGEF